MIITAGACRYGIGLTPYHPTNRGGRARPSTHSGSPPAIHSVSHDNMFIWEWGGGGGKTRLQICFPNKNRKKEF